MAQTLEQYVADVYYYDIDDNTNEAVVDIMQLLSGELTIEALRTKIETHKELDEAIYGDDIYTKENL